VVGPATAIAAAASVWVGLLIMGVEARMALAVAGGALCAAAAVYSLECGIATLLVSVVLFQRSALFAASIPFLGGGLKPTDLLLLATLFGWALRTSVGVVMARGWPRRRDVAFPRRAAVLSCAFVGWAILCSLLAIARGVFYKDSLLELRPLLQYLLFVPLVLELDARRVRRLAWLLLLSSVVIALKALAYYAMGRGETALYTGGGIRVMEVGFAYLLLAFVLSIALYLEDVGRKPTLALIAALNLCALAVTFYRSALLALAVAVAFLIVVSPPRRRAGLLKLGAGAALVVALVDYKQDVSALHRLREWKAAVGMIEAHPVLGNGLGARVGFVSPMYSPERHRMGYWSNDVYMHNSYMWVLTKMGLVGFGLFAALILLVLRTALVGLARTSPSEERGVLVGLSAGLVALLVLAVFGPMLTTVNTAPFVAFAFGAIHVLAATL
jgi:O-antigen ligase